MQILSRFNTQHLLGLTAVCRRFRDLVVRIVRSRLILAENINDRKLILECYHPTAQYTEPYLFCNYLGTSRLSGSRESSETSWKSKVKYDCLGNLGGLYSRFNPARADAISGNRNCHSTEDISKLPDRELRNGSIARTLSIESHELFSLLCVDVAIVQLGPRPGVFLSCTDILKKTTARVWRQWLAEKSTETHSSHKWREPESMIWVDSNQNVGLRVRVQERKWGRDAPILQQRDEDEAISYTLELEGKRIYL